MDGLDAIKDLAGRAGKFQEELDEMGCGDPLKKENAELRRQLEEAQAENERLRGAVEDLTLAAAEAGTTLESVDPNAPCVDQIDEAIGKHLRYTAPVLRAHSEQEATDETTTA